MVIAQMPIITSSYWNIAHGNTPEQLLQDKEGIQTMRNLGKNMVWILKCIKLGKENNINVPQNEVVFTNFIRQNI